MRYSFNCLKEYVRLDVSEKEIEEAITSIGFEVESLAYAGMPTIPELVVGEVLASEPHPNADRLKVCSVRFDEAQEPAQIVCGATNYRVGDRVPVALPGAVLPGNFKIKASKLRGVASQGMMCSARELGLGQDHEGLMILEEKPPIGTSVNRLFPDQDVIFDVEITPNRPDCLSHIGLARELSVYFKTPLILPELSFNLNGKEQALENIEVEVVDPLFCPHYRAYRIRGVQVGPSPAWLRRRIESLGLRSINNVVDITQYVMLETGQPLHAFDEAKIKGKRLSVRPAKPGESVHALNDKTYALSPSINVIADAEGPQVIAGVMGAKGVEVDGQTRDLILEVAQFQPASIRQAGQQLGISSDSRYRFERATVDPHRMEWIARRSIDQILAVCGGTPDKACTYRGEALPEPRRIAFNPSQIEAFCGFTIPESEALRIFEALELRLISQEDDTWVFEIPSFRGDLSRPVDLIEELVRHYGCAQIESAQVSLREETDPEHFFRTRAQAYLLANRFYECYHYSFVNAQVAKTCVGEGAAENIALENPISQEYTHLRPSLMPGLLDALLLNQNRSTGMQRLFELGHVFLPTDKGIQEHLSLAFLATETVQEPNWYPDPGEDYFSAKAWMQSLLSTLNISVTGWSALRSDSYFYGGHSAHADTDVEGLSVRVGLLDPSLTQAFGIKPFVYGGSLTIPASALKIQKPIVAFKPMSHYPAVSKDLALVVKADIPAQNLRREFDQILNAVIPKNCYVERLSLFDYYQGDNLADGRKSLAFSFQIRSNEGTLSEEAVHDFFEALVKRIQSNTPYEIRGLSS